MTTKSRVVFFLFGVLFCCSCWNAQALRSNNSSNNNNNNSNHRVGSSKVRRHVASSTSRNSKQQQQQQQRSLKHKGTTDHDSDDNEGPGQAGPPDNQDGKGAFVYTRRPTVSPPTNPPTMVPTGSAEPSLSTAPSGTPTLSTAPSKGPTSHPTQTPSTTPSAIPTAAPSPGPSGMPSPLPTLTPSTAPSLSQTPTENPYSTQQDEDFSSTNNNNNNNNNNNTTALVSSCNNDNLPTTGITPVVRQVVEYQVAMAVDRSQFTGSANTKAGQAESALHPRLAAALLGSCTYGTQSSSSEQPQMIRLHTGPPDVVQGMQTDQTCPVGRLCWIVAADFTVDLFYYLSSSSSGQDGRLRHLQQQQQQQDDSPALQYTLDDNTLMSQLAAILAPLYETLDTGDDSEFTFLGFSNAGATTSTGDVPLDDTTDRGGDDGIAAVASNANLENSSSSSRSGASVLAGLLVAAAAAVLILVTIFAVQRQRKARNVDKLAARHLALDDDDDDDFYDDEFLTRGDDDSELKSNPETADILADLQDYEEEVSSQSQANATTYSRKVYVLSDIDSRDARTTTTDSGIEIDPNWTPNRFGMADPNEQAPLFIKTTALKASLQDLQPTPATVVSQRSYVADDTVDL